MSIDRTELVVQITGRANLIRVEAGTVFGTFQNVLIESLAKGETVRVTGLSSAERVERATRIDHSPCTHEETQISAGFGAKFSADSALKKVAAKE